MLNVIDVFKASVIGNIDVWHANMDVALSFTLSLFGGQEQTYFISLFTDTYGGLRLLTFKLKITSFVNCRVIPFEIYLRLKSAMIYVHCQTEEQLGYPTF